MAHAASPQDARPLLASIGSLISSSLRGSTVLLAVGSIVTGGAAAAPVVGGPPAGARTAAASVLPASVTPTAALARSPGSSPTPLTPSTWRACRATLAGVKV